MTWTRQAEGVGDTGTVYELAGQAGHWTAGAPTYCPMWTVHCGNTRLVPLSAAFI